MAGTLNALGLLAVIGIAIFVLWRHGRRPKRFWPVLLGIMWGFVAMVVTTALCTEPGFMQLTIPALCIMVTYPALEDRQTRQLYQGVFGIAMLTLCVHYVIIVSNSSYTGNTGRINHVMKQIEQINCEHIEELVQQTPKLGQQSYPAGYLNRLPLSHYLNADDRSQLTHYLKPVRIYTAYPLWHTKLTGLFGRRSHEVQLWYPGGRVREAITHLEYRR